MVVEQPNTPLKLVLWLALMRVYPLNVLGIENHLFLAEVLFV